MDEMKIKLSTKFMRNFIAKLISKIVYKKLGYKIDVQLNDLDINLNNGNASIKLNAEACLKYEELIKIINSVNLD